MRTRRRFLVLLTMLLMVVVFGFLLIFMTLVATHRTDDSYRIESTSLFWTTDRIYTAVAATTTAKSFTATPSEQH